MSDTGFRLIAPLLSLIDARYEPIPALIAAHLQWLHRAGVRDVLVLGTTGEFPHLSVGQRQRYLEAIVNANPGMTVMVNIGASALADVLELQAHALSQPGVTSILWMPPFYFRHGEVEAGLLTMLNRLLEQQPEAIPFYGYHYPKLSQVELSADFINQASRLAGIKDTSGDFERIAALREQCPNKALFVGTDFKMAQSRALGCDGVISSLANIAPERVMQCIRQDDLQGEEALKQLRAVLQQYGKMPAMKAWLNHVGLTPEKTVSTLPLTDLKAQETQALIDAVSVWQKETQYAG